MYLACTIRITHSQLTPTEWNDLCSVISRLFSQDRGMTSSSKDKNIEFVADVLHVPAICAVLEAFITGCKDNPRFSLTLDT